MKNNKKGFTLMEMLIVVAIIAVLVAIAIPVLSGALEKSREAADAANIRSAYAEVMVCALQDEAANGVTKGTDGKWSKDVDATQQDATSWLISIDNIAGLPVGTGTGEIAPSTSGWTVTYDPAATTNPVTITAK